MVQDLIIPPTPYQYKSCPASPVRPPHHHYSLHHQSRLASALRVLLLHPGRLDPVLRSLLSVKYFEFNNVLSKHDCRNGFHTSSQYFPSPSLTVISCCGVFSGSGVFDGVLAGVLAGDLVTDLVGDVLTPGDRVGDDTSMSDESVFCGTF